MLGYLLTLVAGFWLGVSGFLYLGCYILEEILDLPQAMVSGIGTESASTAHTRLKRLVQRVIEEAMALPAMLDYSGLRGDSVPTPKLPEFDAKTYEDLLATAILNKVIDRYQQDYERDRERSSGIHSESASPSSSHVDDEVDLNSNSLGKRALESGLGIDRSTPSPSSIEPLSRDGSNHSETSDHFHTVSIVNDIKLAQTEYSSDEEYLEGNIYKSPLEGALSTIDFSHKNRVPFPEYGGDIVDIEVSQELPYQEVTSEELFNEEYHLNGDIHTVNNTWEENWLFQKKRLKTAQSVPVPMLVPNSTTEYRAMIGDRDAEDTTDLSEAGSDEENSLENDIKHVLVNSKTLIGGKNLGSLLGLEEDVNHNSEDILTPIIETNMKDPVDELNVKNKIEDESQNVQAMRTKPKEAVAMLVEIDSGPLTKAEFSVSEIHRGVSSLETEPIINVDSLNISYTFDTSVQSEFNENQLKTLNTVDLNENIPDFIDPFTEATNLDVIDFTINGNEQLNSLQQKESEYSETIAVPVQRHLDSLKRMTHDSSSKNSLPKETLRLNNVDVLLETNGISTGNLPDADHFEKDEVDAQQIFELPPDSISVREKQKWLNTVPMPNNPYSAEAIEKRLSNKNSSIFDIITNGIPMEDETPKPEKEIPTPPKTLKDVLIEDVQEYKRYGRDYYIKEAKQSAGSRKKLPYFPHNDSKEIMGTTFKRDSLVLVSARKSLNELEASTLHNNITRVCLTPRNASSQFAKNPLYRAENLDNSNLGMTDKEQNFDRLPAFGIINGDSDRDVDDDSLRLKIPVHSDVTEKIFHTLKTVRNNDSLRSFRSLPYNRRNVKNIFDESMY